MCLSYSHKRIKAKYSKTRIGYKVYKKNVYYQGLYYHDWSNHPNGFKLNKKYTANYGPSKKPGFHFFFNLDDANNYKKEYGYSSYELIVCKVRLNKILRYGYQDGRHAGTCREITILGECK